MWSIIYISLKDEEQINRWVNEYQSGHENFSDGIKIVKISDYLEGMYGPTIDKISKASMITMALAGVIIFVVILLLHNNLTVQNL